MLTDLFKNINSSLEDVLKNAEAGEGTIKDNMDDLCDILEDEILKSKSSEEEKKALLKRLRNFCNTETNIMLVGATGCGKSSTINALFSVGENPEEVAVDDEVYAKEILRQTSYYSLIGGYKDIFKNPTTKKYKDGTKFEDIVELYYFDESLRQLFLKYLIKVENEIKSQVSYYFTEKNGENQKEYLDTANYNYVGRKNQRDIDRLIKILEGYVTKPTDYHYINHVQKKYGNVPLWVLMNALTFGNISKMYMLLPQDIQSKVSRNYSCINESQMISVLVVMVKFRNVCAHGERLFTYRTTDSIPDLPLHMKLKIAQKGTQYVNGKNDLFSVVIALRYMLSDGWYKEFIKELKTLIDKYLKKHDSISEQELYERMGFPENWRKITRYRKQ